MKLDVLGLWHRHPGSMDVFSGTDDGTNLTFARMNPNGAISGLVNIDPAFRFTLRHVTAPLHYEIVAFEVGDDLIPEEFFELRQYPAKGLHPEIGGGAVDEKKNCGTSTADKSENRFKQNKRRKRSAKEIFHKTLPYICVAIASCLITLLCCRAPKVAANKEDGDVVTNATTGRPAATNKGLFDKIKSWFEKDAGEVNNTGETQIKEDATCAPEQGNSPTPSTTETTSI
jgi:hypothetical protein